MNFLKRIQSLPESKKKIILWSTVIIIGFTLFILWVKNVQEKLKIFQGEGLNLPSLKEEFKGMPKIEMPEISEDYNPPATSSQSETGPQN